MDTKGSCFHCGIEDTLTWRTGLPDKPALCNVCRLRWETSGTLDGFIVKDAKDAQSSQPNLCPMLNTTSFASILSIEKQKFFGSNLAGNHRPTFTFGSFDVGHDQVPFVFKSGVHLGSGSGIAASEKNTQTQDVGASNYKIAKKKRSTVEQQVQSPTERLHQQLYISMEEQSNNDEEDPESLLIFERINKYIPENEIGLGCMLLKPPPCPDEDSKKESMTTSSVAAKVALSGAKDFELPIKNDSSFPTEESFEDDNSFKSETLAISTQSTREPRSNNPLHPMVTRSKGKNRDSGMLLKGIGAYGEVEVKRLNRRPQVASPFKRARGRPRKSQGQGTGNSMFPQNESKINQLTNNMNDRQNNIVSNLTDEFTFLQIQNMQTMEVDERKTSGSSGIKPWEMG